MHDFDLILGFMHMVINACTLESCHFAAMLVSHPCK